MHLESDSAAKSSSYLVLLVLDGTAAERIRVLAAISTMVQGVALAGHLLLFSHGQSCK